MPQPTPEELLQMRLDDIYDWTITKGVSFEEGIIEYLELNGYMIHVGYNNPSVPPGYDLAFMNEEQLLALINECWDTTPDNGRKWVIFKIPDSIWSITAYITFHLLLMKKKIDEDWYFQYFKMVENKFLEKESNHNGI